MKIKLYINRFLLLVISAVFSFSIRSQNIQRYNSFSYNVNEGLLQSTIGDIAYDKNNFCWISFPNGIQKFNGKDFTVVPVQPGLPDDKFTTFFKCKNGDLLVSHSQGISKYEISCNKFIPIYSNNDQKTPSQFIGEDENIIYFYSAPGIITGIDCHTYKLLSQQSTDILDATHPGNLRITISTNIINHKAAFNINSRLFLVDLKVGKLIFCSGPVEYISPSMLRLKNENEVIYYDYKSNNTLLLYNFVTKTTSNLLFKGKDDELISSCVIYSWQNKRLIALSNKLYETDSTLQTLKSELVNFQNKSLAGNARIIKIIEDNFGNLCIQTVQSGIIKIIRNNYPVKYYGTDKKENNFTLSILPDKKNNRILTGVIGKGLFIFDTLQRLIKHIETLPGKMVSFSPNLILQNNKGDYLLYNSGEKQVWNLSSDLTTMQPYSMFTSLPKNKAGLQYFANFLFRDEKRIITQSQGHIYNTDLINNIVTEYEFTNSYCMGGLYCNGIIISHANDELLFIDTATFRPYKTIPFRNTGYVRCFTANAANDIFVGTNKGIFKIDTSGNILLQLTKENGLPDECIYSMAFDAKGSLWFSTNKGIFKLNKNNGLLQLKKEDGLQENEFNTNVLAKSEDGEFFFGGVNGVSSFYPETINGFEEKINLLVTKIKINNIEQFKDTAVWNIEKIDVPYYQNAISIDFIAMANNNPGQYIYQYQMKGVDEQWIQNNDMQTIRYHLPPGKYVFKIYASRVFNKDATAMKEIVIWIHPPFWKTWWFITAISLFFVITLAYGINRYNRNKFQKKVAELESEHKIQLERERISRDLHDNIGAYASTVLYKTDLLQSETLPDEKNELMNDLRFASKDIITSLRETIWALKKEQYDAQECLLRMRNFIQPFTRYYPGIHFTVSGEAPPSMILHYTKALNLVRIVQEAVANAIKHSGATSISIISSIENKKWKVAISDNGKGFDYEGKYKLQEGNGLNNMKQRAADSGFALSIESGNDKGTTIVIFV